MHAERDDRVAKFCLDPVRLQRSGGLRRSEIGRIARIIGGNQTLLVEACHEYFNG